MEVLLEGGKKEDWGSAIGFTKTLVSKRIG